MTHEFKVGDWVRPTFWEGHPPFKIMKIEDDFLYMDESGGIEVEEGLLWEPEEDEWCWIGSLLVQVLEQVPNQSLISYQYYDAFDNVWVSDTCNKCYCTQPHIGELPDY